MAGGGYMRDTLGQGRFGYRSSAAPSAPLVAPFAYWVAPEQLNTAPAAVVVAVADYIETRCSGWFAAARDPAGWPTSRSGVADWTSSNSAGRWSRRRKRVPSQDPCTGIFAAEVAQKRRG